MDEKLWKIGDLAAATGLTVRTLHHYDEIGLLRPSERTQAGYRLWRGRRSQALRDPRPARPGIPLGEIRRVEGDARAR